MVSLNGRTAPERSQPRNRLDRMPNDPHAWLRAALDEFEAPLIAYAQRITGNLETARDVCQDTFLKLARAGPEAEQELRGRLAEWLFTVCRNQALDTLRRDRTRRRAETDMQTAGTTPHGATAPPHLPGSPGSPPAPCEALERAEDQSLIAGALGHLPANQQEAIRLKFEHGLSYKQIAKVLETSVGNVGWLLHTGLRALRGELAGSELAGSEPGRGVGSGTNAIGSSRAEGTAS